MANAESNQNPPICRRLKALSALPTLDPVLFFNPAAPRMDLADTASQRLNAARRLMETMAIHTLKDADEQALQAISDAAYLLLSDGCDLFEALAFQPPLKR